MATSQIRTSYVQMINACINAPIPTPNKLYNGINTAATGGNVLTTASALFLTNGINVGDVVINVTDFKAAEITAINSNTQLTLSNSNIWVSANAVYNIYKQSNTGGIPNQGAMLYNGSSTAYTGTAYTMDGFLFTFYLNSGSIMPIQVSQLVSWAGPASSIYAVW